MAIKAKKLQPAKVESIEALKDKFEKINDYIFTDYRGLTVEQITNLRKELRKKGCEFKVVKNNFARLAFEQLKLPDASGYLVGPTAVAIAKDDAGEVAKILFDFTKESPLKVKGGVIDRSIFDKAQVEAFSKLPGKKQLVSMLMSVMNAPARNLACVLAAIPTKLVRTLKAVEEKMAQQA
jgi:large subunit ribosomal protein L10